MAAQQTPHQDTRQRLWLLLGPKAGDNAQARTLGEALVASADWRLEEKHLAFQWLELLLHLRSRPTLLGLTEASRAGLIPPWPDLVITAGRRNELVARWIRDRAGGRSRLVHLGRPWSRPERFDLVVSTPQYALPPGPGIMVNPLPLQKVPRPASDTVGLWRRRLESLPRPWMAVLIGGNSGPFVFSADLAHQLARQLDAFAVSRRISLLVTTSPRTPRTFARQLRAALSVPHYFHRWGAGAAANPYPAFLNLADCIAVTAESVSMITEAVMTGKPVYLLPTVPRGRPWWLRPSGYRWRPLTHRLTRTLAPARYGRDVGRIHAALEAAGRVSWLGDGAPPAPRPGEDFLAPTVARIRALVDAGHLQ